MSAFFAACKAGDTAAVSRLLAADATLLSFRGAGTADAVVGNTAAHWASAKGQVDVLRLLIAAGADMAARNNGDTTPLGSAAMNNHVECARVLMGAGADPRLADDFGDSPLSLAERAGHAELAALLSGAPPPAPPRPDAATCKQKGNEAFARKAYDEAIEW